MPENLTLIDAENAKVAGTNWEKLALVAINSCPKIKKEREKEVLIERFGIGKNPKTLNAIGKSYSVTRERIRQIVNNAVKKIAKYSKDESLAKSLDKIEKFVTENGGFATIEAISEKFAGGIKSEENALKFITTLSSNLTQVKESNSLKEGWLAKPLKESRFKEISKKAVSALKEKKEVMTLADIAAAAKEDPALVKAVLSGTKAVMETDAGKWGLAKWPHVNPKSIRDKSKYIMARHRKPIHYADLTEKIGKIGAKNVTKQSVHNELIKNPDFVLVGRGIYALSEWGYRAGVVEEVILEVLVEAGEPLHKSVIIDRVLEKRIVKASTIILNLQKDRFKRVGKAVYTINE